MLATAPANIQGKMEVRGIGIIDSERESDVPVCLLVEISEKIERFPEGREWRLMAGIEIPVVVLNALEPSAPVKVELALRHVGPQSSLTAPRPQPRPAGLPPGGPGLLCVHGLVLTSHDAPGATR